MKTLTTKITYLSFLLLLLFQTSYAQQWTGTGLFVSENRSQNGQFGTSVSMNANVAIIGSLRENDPSSSNTAGPAASYILERNASGQWVRQQRLSPADEVPTTVNAHGHKVAIWGQHAAIYTGNNRLIHCYEKTKKGRWFEKQTLDSKIPDSISPTGTIIMNKNYMILGAPSEGWDKDGNGLGAVYIYEKDKQSNWLFTQKIKAPHGKNLDLFGRNLAISGNYLIVGAHNQAFVNKSGETIKRAGAAYIFERDTHGKWNLAQRLVSNDLAANDFFGHDVAIEGNYAIVSAWLEDEDEWGKNNVPQAGAVYVFERDKAGNWSQIQKIVERTRLAGNSFGSAIALNENRLVITAFPPVNPSQATSFPRASQGVIYTYERDTKNRWVLAQQLTAPNQKSGLGFGQNIGLSGTTLIVGHTQEANDLTGNNALERAGAAFTFEYR